jgi:hypothetical protein
MLDCGSGRSASVVRSLDDGEQNHMPAGKIRQGWSKRSIIGMMRFRTQVPVHQVAATPGGVAHRGKWYLHFEHSGAATVHKGMRRVGLY